MSEFTDNQISLSVPIEGEIRTTLSSITFVSKEGTIIVPIGLETDLGSIPRILRGIFPNDGKAMFAYILHDFLYRDGLFSRSICDDILEEAMEYLKVGWFTRKSVRAGLKVGGWAAWNKHRKRDKNEKV